MTVGTVSSAVPSSVTEYFVFEPSEYSVNTTVAPVGGVDDPSAFFYALVAKISFDPCVLVIVSPLATGSVVDAS